MEGSINQPDNLERKRQEFFARVDAGDFDDVIKARDIHESEQSEASLEETNRINESPTTPEELIKAASYSLEMSDFMSMTEEDLLADIMKKTGQSREQVLRERKEVEERAKAMFRLVEKKGHIAYLREKFKKDPKNLRAYIEGKL